MKHTLKSFISCSLFFFALSAFAQETPKKDFGAQRDSIDKEIHYYPQRYGLRVGLDLFRTTRSLYDKTYSGFEVTGDYRLSKNWYAAAEIGHDKMDRNENNFGFTTNGNYIRLGANYNLNINWMDREDLMYVGFRYGLSSFSQTLNWYKPYTTDPYFPTQRVEANKKYSGLSAHWVEFVAGIKTRVFNNVFMGFSLRLNGLISQTQPEDFENLYIPGFNKKHSGAIGVGFNYSISYFIPFYKSKKNKFVMPSEDEKSKYDLEGNLINSTEIPSTEQSNPEEADELRIIEQNKKNVK